jgi:hypothetical protein
MQVARIPDITVHVIFKPKVQDVKYEHFSMLCPLKEFFITVKIINHLLFYNFGCIFVFSFSLYGLGYLAFPV